MNDKNHLIENRQIRVFISSTFNDMQNERDYLMKYTFPELKQLASERDVLLTELDLRWGITEEEAKSGKVVEICLKEIDYSVPFFIGIIGNRYGWIPERANLDRGITEQFPIVESYLDQHLSVTEMEMQYGVLQRPEDMHAYFYIKEENNVSPCDCPEALEKLKSCVRDNGRYPVGTYSSVEDLASQVKDAFKNLLNELFPQKKLTPYEYELLSQQSYRNSQCVNYIPSKDLHAQVKGLLTSSDCPIVLTGKSGLGKSAFIANFTKELECDDSYSTAYYFIGNGSGECNHNRISSFLIHRIKDIYGFEKADTLEECFAAIESRHLKPLIILLDAVNQIEDSDNAKLMNWMPSPSKSIKIIYSTLEDDSTMDIFHDRGYSICTLYPLDISKRKELIKSYLQLYAKSLNENQVQWIASEKICENTLVLKTILDELVSFGIYEKLNSRIEYFLSSLSAPAFFDKLLESYENDFSKDSVAMILSLVAASKNGLSEDEITRIAGLRPIEWSRFYCSFRSHMHNKSSLIDFSHSQIREAIKLRYLSEKSFTNQVREKILDDFLKRNDGRSLDEIPYQYFMMEDTESLHRWFISDIKRTKHILDVDASELVKYWKAIIAHGKSLSDYIECLNAASPEDRIYIELISLCIEYFSDYSTAESICLSLRKQIENGAISEKETILKLYIWEGILSRSKSDYTHALEMFQKAYEFSSNEFGENHIYCSYPLKHIGTIFNERREYSQADNYYHKALAIQEKNGQDKEAIDTIHSIADNCLDSRDFDKAEKYLSKALQDTYNLFGRKNTTAASILNSLSALYDYTDQYDKSIKTLQASMELDKELLGSIHIDIAHGYHNLAMTYKHAKEFGKAEDCFKEAIRIKGILFGNDNYETSISMAGLAEVYRDEGKFSEAVPLHKKYLDIYLDTMGEDSYAAIILAGIGSDYYGLEDYDNALIYHLQALEIDKKYSTKAHSQYYNAVGNDLYCLDRYEEALNYYNAGLNAADEEDDKYGKSIFYNCIGDCFGFLGDFKAAKESFEKALYIREKLLQPGDSRIEKCKQNILKAERAIKGI